METWYTHEQWVDILSVQESSCCSYSALHFSFQFSNIKNICHIFSGTVRPTNFFFIGTHMENGWMYRVHRNLACFFIFLSSSQSLKIEI